MNSVRSASFEHATGTVRLPFPAIRAAAKRIAWVCERRGNAKFDEEMLIPSHGKRDWMLAHQ
jgi:hypothetical protein